MLHHPQYQDCHSYPEDDENDDIREVKHGGT